MTIQRPALCVQTMLADPRFARLAVSDLMTSPTDSDVSFDSQSVGGAASDSSTKEVAEELIHSLRVSNGELHARVKKCVKQNKQRANEIFVTDIGGWTPFHAVALRGPKRTLKLMLNSGVDINHKMGKPDDIPGGCTALHVAAYRGDVKIVKSILSRGARVNVRNDAELPPIYYAMISQNIDVVNMLLLYGADIRGVETTEPSLSEKQARHKHRPTVLRGFAKMFGTHAKKS